MAHSDDPPYLSVGTEVSAKYRGAFCEATIKVAKKLVKCKVSYSKGQTAIVNHDLIRGSLKANSQVEVRQTDGIYQPATIIRLMDNTTYTVVFDDGDERTLRRSSLCLKGARHFDESETLNHLPLTDPENFGTPVQVKIGRKRHRNSLGPHAEDDGGTKRVKGSSYPPDFPVGKTVFLENDRRRSSWLPAVVVPTHYLEESELTSDKLCIRSFKDGRFYAVPKEDLHDFAPDKEPLQSMLEGEIQAMYLDKPSIERAMAYLDTGELPWDMDIFDKNSAISSPDGLLHEEGEEPEGEELMAKKEQFKNKLKTYCDSKGISYPEQPVLGPSPLDLYKLYALMKDNGGMDKVTQEMKWHSILLQMGFTSDAITSSTAIRMAYKKYLYGFEMFEKGKGRGPRDTPLRRKSSHTNMASETAEESEEEGEEKQTPKAEDKRTPKGEERRTPKGEEKQTPKGEEKQTPKGEDKRTPKGEEKRTPKGEDKRTSKGEDKRTPKGEDKQTLKGEDKQTPKGENKRTPKGGDKPIPKVEDKQTSKGEEKQATPTTVKPLRKLLSKTSICASDKVDNSSEVDKAGDEKEKVLGAVSSGSSPRTEKRVPELDQDDWQVESSSSNGDDTEERHVPVAMDGVEPSKTGYEEGNRVLVWYGKGKQQLTYEAKIIGVDKVVESDQKEYLVHYSGWNTRYDEWVDETRIAGKLSSPSSSSSSSLTSRGTTKLNQKTKNQAGGGNGGKRGKGPGTADSPQMEESVAKDSAAVATPPTALATLVTTPSAPVLAGTPNTGSARSAKGRGAGRRRKISSSLESSDCNSPTAAGNISEEAVDIGSRVGAKVMETKLSAVNVESVQGGDGGESGGDGDDGVCPEQLEAPGEDSGHVGCGSVESSTEEPPRLCDGVSPSELPATEEKPPQEELKVKLEEEIDKEVGRGSDDEKKVTMEGGEEAEVEAEVKKEQECGQMKLADDEVFDDDAMQEEEEVELEQERNSSSNSSIHPDPSGCSPPMSVTNSPVDPPISPSKQEDPTEEAQGSCKSGSDKGVSPTTLASSSKRASSTPERKRKWRDLTLEEYEERIKARREELNFSVDTSSLMQMTNSERIVVIQERIRELQKRWQDLKAEVTYLDRRKRTARRKEKEARTSNSQGSPSHLISISS